MSRTSNDQTKSNTQAHRDARTLEEFISSHTDASLFEGGHENRYLRAVCALPQSTAFALLTLLILRPHLISELPRFNT